MPNAKIMAILQIAKGSPLSVIYGIENFSMFSKKNSSKGPPSLLLMFCDRMDVEKSQMVPLSIFFGIHYDANRGGFDFFKN